MTSFLNKKSGLVLLLICSLFIAKNGLADDGSQAPAESDQAAPSSTTALNQFPQAEVAPMVQNQAAAVPAPQDLNTSGINFPKVKTSEDEKLAKQFSWWPSDAQPAPVKDEVRSGYWWWPTKPGKTELWGNQGYIYVRKVIFDYKSSEGEMKPSLVIKRILKNVKVFFDYDKSELRGDAQELLQKAMYTLEHNPKADILITGNADVRGSEKYNEKLGERRAASVQKFMVAQGLSQDRIRILSRGKLDALAPVKDIVGMQKDRNAQFMIAEVEEVMIPAEKAQYFQDKVVEERQEVESAVKVDTKEYTIQAGDTLWAIAKREYGNGNQWKRIYEFNKEIIPNPNKPKKGLKIQIPIE